MKPALFSFQLGERAFALPSYGTAVLLGFALATWLAARQARRTDVPREAVLDLAFWMLLAGIAGSRLLFVLLNAGHYARLCTGGGNCLAALAIWDGGLVFFGGVAAATAVAVAFARRQRLRFPALADLFAPGLALAHAVGRLGCFGAGCCFGKACASAGPPCVAFPPASVAHLHLVAAGQLAPGAAHTPALHPTQLYESAALLGIFFLLVGWRRRQRFHGQTFLVYLGAYGLVRFALELSRGDTSRRFLLSLPLPALARALALPPAEPLLLSVAQALALTLLLTAAALLLKGRSRAGDPRTG